MRKWFITVLVGALLSVTLPNTAVFAWLCYDQCGPNVPNPPPPPSPNLSGLTRVDIDVITGGFNLNNCPIAAAGYASCVDPSYSLVSQRPVCSATAVYSDGHTVSGSCWLGNLDETDAGVGPVQVTDPQGCTTFSYGAVPNAASAIYFKDPAQNTWALDGLAWTAASFVQVSRKWMTNTVQLTASAQGGGLTKHITINLSGQLSGAACLALEPTYNFAFSLSGAGTVQ
jgi:hypothetical protein